MDRKFDKSNLSERKSNWRTANPQFSLKQKRQQRDLVKLMKDANFT